ncbi:MAG: helicase-associated domain-containing protein [Actinobacteria bacterium]|nr:helicase-associated domain-containing protein [Actinomycetota bacterium]MBU1493890.1 helicase-associated domain-containing protein [Actinomycetota bacterium]MBU1865362.1 helicase-associated domain-containing protein [Actinomycetota bacterium]
MTYGSAADAATDRLHALQTGGPEAIAAVLRRLPIIGAAAAGMGPMSGHAGDLGGLRRGGSPVATLDGLAGLLADPVVIKITLLTANRIEQQLAQVAHFHGGSLAREEALRIIGADPGLLDRAADGLAGLLLSNPAMAWVTLRPGVAEQIWLPGVRLRDYADSMVSEQLAGILRRLGLPVPTTKWQRVDALEKALRTREVVEDAIGALGPQEREHLATLFTRGQVRIHELGYDHQGYRGSGTVRQLASVGLVGYSPYDQTAWVWLDVVAALGGAGLFADWAMPEVSARPVIPAARSLVPPVVARLDQLLDHWASGPPQGLKAGGIGVKPVRAAAKALRTTPVEIGLLTCFAVAVGLLAPVTTARRGRGRNQSIDEEWRPTTACTDWRALPLAQRWGRIVRWWADSTSLEASGRAVERYQWDTPRLNRPLARTGFLHALAILVPGEGLDPADLRSKLVFDHHGVFAPVVVDQLVAEARVLGLVPVEGPVGLTRGARLLVSGAEALDDVLNDAAASFTVQADHSVVAPPDLHPDLIGDLERIAHLESDAGARIYRITPEDTVRALDGGWTLDRVIAFLADHSTVAIPQNVERTIRDAAERHGRLQVGAAATWVASDDPALLVRALGVKAARLEGITPTLAVSSLPSEKVLESLRAKGLAPAERVNARPQTPSPTIPSRTRHDGGARLAMLAPDEIEALARRLYPVRGHRA